jgi:hypothetical protein
MSQTSLWHVCGTPGPADGPTRHHRTPKDVTDQPRNMRADDGNRTRMTSLEGWSSTIELHPRGSSPHERHL